MKYLLLILLAFPHAAGSQIRMYNSSLTDSTQSILYTGVDNRIIFLGINADKFDKRIVNGILSRVESNVYVVRTDKTGDTATITVSDKKKVVLERKFVIEMIPEEVATVGYLEDSTATVSRLLLNPFLTVGCRCNYRIGTYVTSFTMTLLSSANENIELLGTGNRFSDEQVKLIKTCNRGDKLYFNNIRALCPSCRTRRLDPFTITIK